MEVDIWAPFSSSSKSKSSAESNGRRNLDERSAVSNQPGRVERQVLAVERKSMVLGRVERQEEPRREVGCVKPAWPSRTAGARG